MRRSHSFPLTSRRRFLVWLGATGIPCLVHPAWPDRAAAPENQALPQLPSLPSFDLAVEDFMRTRSIPGGALAVVKDRRLIYARGYGWADRASKTPVQPASLFRIASLSKPITALAIMKLVEDGRLNLDAHVVDLIQLDPPGTSVEKPEIRWNNITVRHLLQHTGGWDRNQSFDPMFRPQQIAKAMGIAGPPGPQAIIRYLLGQRLDFDPGTHYAYSNFGYCLLGRVIEWVTGLPYAPGVQQLLLAPAGITSMRLGASLQTARAPGEVHYYTAHDRTVPTVFPAPAGSEPAQAQVPEPYGGFCLEAMDSHGGWLASVVDLARLTAALDDPNHSPLLNSKTFQTVYARPDPPAGRNADGSLTDFFYACGWLVRPAGQGGRPNYWHTGSLPGTHALWVRRGDGLSWIALFNQRSEDPKLPDSALDPALHRAADPITLWPEIDLLPRQSALRK